jgi:hypothetical protein
MVETEDQVRSEIDSLRAEIRRLSDRGKGTLPGPTITRRLTEAYAWCVNFRCELFSEQRPVVVFLELVEHTYGMRGASLDAGGVRLDAAENSMEYLRFPDDVDKECSACGGHLELSQQLRPSYERLNEQDPLTLLKRKRSGVTPEMVIAEAAAKRAAEANEPGEVGALRDQLARQQAQLAFLMGQRTGQTQTLPPEFTDLLIGNTQPPEPEPEPEPEANPMPEDRVLPRGIVRLDTHKFKAIWRDEHGKQRSANKPTAEEAIAVREQMLAEVAAIKERETGNDGRSDHR